MKNTLLILVAMFIGAFANATAHNVDANNYSFTPQVLSINQGDTVVWVNTGGFHNVNGVNNTVTGMPFNNPESFTSSPVNAGNAILTHVFNIPGTYNYDCSVGSHAANGMTGTIIVNSMTTVVDVIVNSPDHNTLETAVIAANLAGALSGPGPFTVFAPTDMAFDNLPTGTLAAVLADSVLLNQILTHHVYAGSALSSSLTNGMMIPTLNGDNLTVTFGSNGEVMIDNAMVTVADIAASNGIVHVIDAVLIPMPATNTVVDVIVNSPDHNTLETAVIAANLAGALSGPGPFTVFAPTDMAFDNLPTGTLAAVLADSVLLNQILTHHVYAGSALSSSLTNGMMIPTLNGDNLTVTFGANGEVMIDNAMVTVADIAASNGIVHVIDAVLIPMPTTNTVVDVIVNSPDHNTLETAVIAANLAGALSGPGPFTVFAPTDMAFDNLPTGTLAAVLADSVLLNQILTHHVYAGSALSSSLNNGMMIPTLNGDNLTVTFGANGEVMIDNAMVTVADIVADNGIVHVIDAVLIPMPTTNTVVDVIVNSPDHNTLETAVITAGLVETLSGPGPFTVFAPTDMAFDNLPAGTLEAVLADQILLNQILTHHVYAGSALSSGLMDGMSIPTLNGDNLTVTFGANGEVMIDNAMVTLADIAADNGVVHVIDVVLIPGTSSISDNFNSFENDYILYTVDILGKKVDPRTRNQVIFNVYKSGKVEKKYIQSWD